MAKRAETLTRKVPTPFGAVFVMSHAPRQPLWVVFGRSDMVKLGPHFLNKFLLYSSSLRLRSAQWDLSDSITEFKSSRFEASI